MVDTFQVVNEASERDVKFCQDFTDDTKDEKSFEKTLHVVETVIKHVPNQPTFFGLSDGKLWFLSIKHGKMCYFLVICDNFGYFLANYFIHCPLVSKILRIKTNITFVFILLAIKTKKNGFPRIFHIIYWLVLNQKWKNKEK